MDPNCNLNEEYATFIAEQTAGRSFAGAQLRSQKLNYRSTKWDSRMRTGGLTQVVTDLSLDEDALPTVIRKNGWVQFVSGLLCAGPNDAVVFAQCAAPLHESLLESRPGPGYNRALQRQIL